MEDNAEDLNVKSPAKILVIDDQESTRNLLKRRLSVYGNEVFLAADEKQAMARLGEQAIDVILLNMFISGSSTYDFLRDLKDNTDFKNIPVIMLSSDGDTDLVVRCIEAGAEDYLVRPLNQTLLRARLANCIARKEAYDKEIAYLAQIEKGQKQIVAQEKMASLGVLMTSISRELKNPLNFVINFSEITSECCKELMLQLEQLKGNVNPEIFNLLSNNLTQLESNTRKIFDYGHSADKIIRFMLDQSNTSVGQKLPTSINKIIQQTITMLMSQYKTSGITKLPKIETTLDETLPHVALSTQSFSKAIHNILDNAIFSVIGKFSDISQAKVIVKTENLGSQVIVSIFDNGSGIKSDVLPKLFTPFFTTKPEGVGLGLGLSTAKEIIDEHKGKIEVKSAENEYAEFDIMVPIE